MTVAGTQAQATDVPDKFIAGLFGMGPWRNAEEELVVGRPGVGHLAVGMQRRASGRKDIDGNK